MGHGCPRYCQIHINRALSLTKGHNSDNNRWILSVIELHAREPLYSNSAVIAWCSQSTGAQNILFWFTVIHSMSQLFTTFNFHDVFFLWNYCLGIVVHSGPIRAFKI